MYFVDDSLFRITSIEDSDPPVMLSVIDAGRSPEFSEKTASSPSICADTVCRMRLADYAVPHLVEFREQLPRTFVGEVFRRKLAEEEGKIVNSGQ